jgi:hypothetical protein
MPTAICKREQADAARKKRDNAGNRGECRPASDNHSGFITCVSASVITSAAVEASRTALSSCSAPIAGILTAWRPLPIARRREAFPPHPCPDAIRLDPPHRLPRDCKLRANGCSNAPAISRPCALPSASSTKQQARLSNACVREQSRRIDRIEMEPHRRAVAVRVIKIPKQRDHS